MIDSISGKLPLQNTMKIDQRNTDPGTSFSSMLMDALEKVNQQQIESNEMTKKLATGEVQDLHQVMIAAQKANISLQLAVQVRNKVVEAYQEIMRMPL